MAIRIGARVKNMEFVQFHPTAFDYPRDPLFLLSEAMRGDGARLVNEKGEQFTDELAPRDEVSRAIFKQKKVFMDFTHEKRDVLAQKFPNIFENLLTAGYDLSKDLIPITPAAHFFCGGIHVDINGQTSVENLYALGETSCTGVHGANRLASNSLTEALVFAESVYSDIESDYNDNKNYNLPVYEYFAETKKDLKIRQEIQEKMWKYAGILRTEKGLKKLIKILENLSPTGTETNNILVVAQSVARSALARKDSIGCHFMQTASD
jgi:L-aspartate oxidase